MKRTELKRGGWLKRSRAALKRLTQLPKKSKQRVKDDREYAKFKAECMRLQPSCESCRAISRSCNQRHWVRASVATDLHHIVPTSIWPAGRLVASNVLCVCRECHEWIHANTAKSYELGLLKRR